jgi:outer membrane protein assembly factor BamB
VDGVLIAQVENDSESYTLGLDKKTGVNLWRLNRPKAANWTSPLALPGGLVALQSRTGLNAIRVADGTKAWSYDDGASTIPSTVVSGGVLYIPSHGITALKLNAADIANTPKQIWRSRRLSPSTASPLVLGAKVYTVNSAGVLTAGDTKSGERLWQTRLKGPFSATPVAAGAHLYFINEKGLMQVVDISGKEGEVVGTLNLDDQFLGSPAIGDGAIYMRSNQKIYKVAK